MLFSAYWLIRTQMRISPVDLTGEAQLSYKKAEVSLLRIFLDIEKYLWSVVSCEIPSGWPVEALKAQAVASRTYALYKACPPNGSTPVSNRALLQTRSLASGDIKIWATDQIYRGKAYEDPRAIESCILTKGQILTYQKLACRCVFSR